MKFVNSNSECNFEPLQRRHGLCEALRHVRLEARFDSGDAHRREHAVVRAEVLQAPVEVPAAVLEMPRGFALKRNNFVNLHAI